MDSQTINLAFYAFFGLLLFFMKNQHDETKDKLKEQAQEISKLRDNTMRKEDFREFKEELYVRLDELKLDLRQEIERLQRTA